MERQRVLLAYDIGQPKLQAQVRKKIREQASSYQLSAYECFLSLREREQLLDQLQPLIADNDSLIACLIDVTRQSFYLGSAQAPNSNECCIID